MNLLKKLCRKNGRAFFILQNGRGGSRDTLQLKKAGL
jgi:hypothetical protein